MGQRLLVRAGNRVGNSYRVWFRWSVGSGKEYPCLISISNARNDSHLRDMVTFMTWMMPE